MKYEEDIDDEVKSTELYDITESKPERMNINILQDNLKNCLRIIDDEVMKGYVTRLDQLPIINQTDEKYEGLNKIHFFKISEMVYQEDEFSVDKLAMIFHAFSNKPCTLVLMLKSDGMKTEFYLGVRPNDNRSSGTLFQMLRQSLLGFFPGCRISEYYDEELEKDMQAIEVGCISSVTSVADYKQEQDMVSNREFIQGLEKFVYAMQGKAYTALLIADNLSYNDLMLKKREYEQIYTQISPFANMQMNFTVSDGKSASDGKSDGKTTNSSYTMSSGTAQGRTDGTSHTSGTNETVGKTESNTHTDNKSESTGKVHTEGHSDGVNHTETQGTSFGTYSGVSTNMGVQADGVSIGGGCQSGVSAGYNQSVAEGTSHTDSVSDSVSKTLTHGLSDSYGQSISRTSGISNSIGMTRSISQSTTNSNAYTSGETFSLVNTKTLTDTFGTSKGITLNAQNMTLNLTMQRLQKHLERIEECESFGMWNFAAYFLGATAAETETAANTYKSVIAGTDSGIERNAINSWSSEDDILKLKPYMYHFMHPQFLYSGFSYDGGRNIAVNPSALVSTNELAIHMGLPRHSVRGLPVVEHAAFGQEVVTRRNTTDSKINLGNIYNMGRETETEVNLDLNSLSMHTFITGSTGSGKSNAVYHLLMELKKKSIPFLVVEPAKGEYKNVFPDINCFGTNPLIGKMLRINPFSFPKGIHVLEHIDRIVEIFNVCWPMYAAMPAVLKESIENAYKEIGWDLEISENKKVPELFPTFDDVVFELKKTIKSSEYSAETQGDYIGSLSTRLKSLTNGINGRVFVSDEMDLAELFDEYAIIDISRVGSVETKSLIMGMVVMKLQEYRTTMNTEMNAALRHVTVLEEAHNILKKTSTEQSADSSNMAGKSVEMLTNTIAEIRTFGEGFVIVDQAPNLLDTAVIRNTNTKIVLRLPESCDRDITGNAIALKEQQFNELSKLPTGVAAVYQNDWQEAVLCKMPRSDGYIQQKSKKENISFSTDNLGKDALLHILIQKNSAKAIPDTIKDMIFKSNVSARARKDLIVNWNTRNLAYEWAVADYIKKNYDLSEVFKGTDCWNDLSELCDIMIRNISDEFADFDADEKLKILYFVCRIEHELYPNYSMIEKLRVEYLKRNVI